MMKPVSQAEFTTRLGLSAKHGAGAIGKQLEALRLKQSDGHSRDAVAELLDVSVFTYRAWEQGNRAPCCGFMRAALLELLEV